MYVVEMKASELEAPVRGVYRSGVNHSLRDLQMWFVGH